MVHERINRNRKFKIKRVTRHTFIKEGNIVLSFLLYLDVKIKSTILKGI